MIASITTIIMHRVMVMVTAAISIMDIVTAMGVLVTAATFKLKFYVFFLRNCTFFFNSFLSDLQMQGGEKTKKAFSILLALHKIIL